MADQDLVAEARELLEDAPVVKDAAFNIEHALFADAIEREGDSPFWGHSKKLGRLYARAPELLSALCDEVERLREENKKLYKQAYSEGLRCETRFN